jgi:hypothetical protein
VLALGALAIALLTPACAGAERPAGIVERWLLSLNQGAAGRPDRYAPDAVSEQVVPGWRDLEPGELDAVEIGTDLPTTTCREPCTEVAFRMTGLDGTIREGVARVERDPGGEWRVAAVEMGASGLPPGGQGWATEGAPAVAWLLTIAVAIALAGAAVIIVRLVPTPPSTTD